MTRTQVTGPDALRRIVLDGPAPEARLAYYAAILSLEMTGGVVDLGPGGPEAEALARLVMRAFGDVPVGTMRRRLMSLRVAAASAVRAGAAPRGGLRRGDGRVEVDGVQHGHAGFFGVDVMDLRHGRFDGGLSARMTREVFVSGDAVTVLPYDPLRDRVLLIEQFRAGPVGRGDPYPWQLEAIAGRIDPGETPEEAARREAVEEAGLTLGDLEKVAEFYPSPGAMTEYLYSYVAICDLPDGVAGVFGAEEEGEDIQGHLLEFEALMAALGAGEITNAPLLLTVLWLQRERARLRAEGQASSTR